MCCSSDIPFEEVRPVQRLGLGAPSKLIFNAHVSAFEHITEPIGFAPMNAEKTRSKSCVSGVLSVQLADQHAWLAAMCTGDLQ